jgi:hypothetical protein
MALSRWDARADIDSETNKAARILVDACGFSSTAKWQPAIC